MCYARCKGWAIWCDRWSSRLLRFRPWHWAKSTRDLWLWRLDCLIILDFSTTPHNSLVHMRERIIRVVKGKVGSLTRESSAHLSMSIVGPKCLQLFSVLHIYNDDVFGRELVFVMLFSYCFDTREPGLVMLFSYCFDTSQGMRIGHVSERGRLLQFALPGATRR